MADAANESRNRMKDAGEAAQTAARDGMEQAADAGRENLRRASADASRAASRGLEMGSQAMDAYVEAGKKAANTLGEVNRAATEAYSRSLSDFEDLSKKAMSCRTAQDLIDLQSTAIQKMQDNFNDMTRVYSLFFTAFTRSAEPVMKRASDAAGQARKAS